jgi:alpha-tubulin suppressor-like RCC1 family protein
VRCWGADRWADVRTLTSVVPPPPEPLAPDAPTPDPLGPYPIPGIDAVSALAAGTDFFCAVADGTHAGGATRHGLYCWGRHAPGRTWVEGVATEAGPETGIPYLLEDFSGARTPRAIALGAFHGCAVMQDGTIECWGASATAPLGSTQPHSVNAPPVVVSGLTGPLVAVAAGPMHSCAASKSNVWCWGANTRGQLGTGEPMLANAYAFPDHDTPHLVVGVAGEIRQLGAGLTHSCALTTQGVYCWGFNVDGQLGNGGDDAEANWFRNEAVAVQGIAGEVDVLSVGTDHACGIAEGRVWCWGLNAWGVVGVDPASAFRVRVAQPVEGLGGDATALGLGSSRSCAVTGAGVYCWGKLSLDEDDHRPRPIAATAPPPKGP